MPERETDPRLIRFGVFEFDLAAHELRKNGRRVRIREQPFRILRLLLAKPGEVVTREELRREIWQDDTFVDFDNSLNAAVANLREALGDSASNPRFILTVPRQGYQFIAPVERASPQALSDPPDWGPSQQLPPKRPAAFRWKTISLFAGCASIALAGLWLNRSQRTHPEAPPTVESLTYYEGVENEAGFSPDGNQVVFTWNGEKQDNFDVYVKTVGGSQLLRLTEHPHRDFSPVWSPDGQWIAFLREIGQDRSAVYRISALGGREEKLLEVAASLRRAGRRSPVDRSLCWSRDSDFLVVVDQESARERPSLFLFSPSTGTKRRLTSAPKGSAGDRSPTFSPDGQKLAFTRIQGGMWRIFILSLQDDLSPAGDPKLLTPSDRVCFGPAWGPNDSEILFSSGPGLWGSHLWAVDSENPNRMRRLGFAGVESYLPAASQTAQRLVYTRRVFEANVWRMELGGGPSKAAPLKLISSTGGDGNFQYSPDGRQIAFSSNRSGHKAIWICSAEGTKQAPLGRQGAGTPRWSPDGKTIAFDLRTPRGDYDIWTISAQGGVAKQLTRGTADDRVPNWSRDGKWIYFASDRGGGHQLWKKALRSGEEVQITRDGGFHAKESPDGAFLYYTKALGNWSVWRVPSGGGNEKQVLKPVNSFTNFAVIERGIYFSTRHGPDGASAILFRDFADGSTTEILRPTKPLSAGLALSPDGRYLLYSQIDREGSDLMLVENFR